jgi:predicted nucleic acid-binding protein
MRALLDTNIIIHRETSRIVNENIGMLFFWLDKLKYQKYVHPVTIEEFQRHTDEKVVKTMAVKLQSYHLMKVIAPLHDDVSKVSGDIDSTDNDKNDTILLNEIYCKRVDCLITEDKKIHTKAKELGISDFVFYIEKFIEKVVNENPELVDYKTLSVKKEYFGRINLQSAFFDSFRGDYQGFDEWFNRKSEEIAYVCSYEGEINSFLFVKKEGKDEDYSDITPKLPPKERLKIGTFKVTANGFKLGERFLKIIFDNARAQKVEEIYVTIFDKRDEQKRLIELMEEWGFMYWGTKQTPTGIENVYVRPFGPPADKNNPRLTFPFLSKEGKVFMVPIYPEYHTELFPDSILQTESPLDFVENIPHRNAISKVYISHSWERGLNTGDLILFYRTGGYYKSVVTTIGIVENLKTPSNFDELKTICRKRTALTEKQLAEYWDRYDKRKPFVVNFLYAYSLPNPFKVNLKRLIELGVLGSVEDAPRGFQEINWDSFVKIYKEAYKR